MKNIERIFKVKYLDKKGKKIEKFMLYKYKTEDLFIAKNFLKLEIPQSKSASVNFNKLSFGNFIMFRAKSEQPILHSSLNDNDAQLKAFDHDGKIISTDPKVEIRKIYAVRNTDVTFYFVNTIGISGNEIFRYDSSIKEMKKIMTIKDHRLLNSVDYLDPSNYLLSIGQLVYHIDVDKKIYKPIYKSDDLCGKVSTIVHHSKLGKITICGGNN